MTPDDVQHLRELLARRDFALAELDAGRAPNWTDDDLDELLSAAVNALPSLLDELDRLRARVREVEAGLRGCVTELRLVGCPTIDVLRRARALLTEASDDT